MMIASESVVDASPKPNTLKLVCLKKRGIPQHGVVSIPVGFPKALQTAYRGESKTPPNSIYRKMIYRRRNKKQYTGKKQKIREKKRTPRKTQNGKNTNDTGMDTQRSLEPSRRLRSASSTGPLRRPVCGLPKMGSNLSHQKKGPQDLLSLGSIYQGKPFTRVLIFDPQPHVIMVHILCFLFFWSCFCFGAS